MRELDVTQKVPAGWRATVAREAASAGMEEVCLVDRLSAERASPHASTADSLPACHPVGQFLSACLPAWPPSPSLTPTPFKCPPTASLPMPRLRCIPTNRTHSTSSSVGVNAGASEKSGTSSRGADARAGALRVGAPRAGRTPRSAGWARRGGGGAGGEAPQSAAARAASASA